MPPPRLYLDFMFSGYTKMSDDGKRVEVVDGTLEPVADTIMFTDDPRVPDNIELAAWKTDEKGMLCLVKPSSGEAKRRRLNARLNKLRQVFYFAPGDVLVFARAKYGKDWARKLSSVFLGKEEFQKLGGLKGITLSKIDYYKDSLRSPDGESPESYKKFYDRQKKRQWYKDNPTRKPPKAFVLSKTRGIFLYFSNKDLPVSDILIWPPGSSNSIKAENINITEGTLCAVILGSQDRLKHGIYSIQIELDSAPKDRWNEKVIQDGSYRLAEKVHFHIKNIAGEFDMINCDPVGLEEAFLVQFPDRYTHLISASSKSDNLYDPDQTSLPSGVRNFVENWSNRAKWSSEKVKLSTKLVNADGARNKTMIIGKALSDAVEPQDGSLKMLKETIALAFSAMEAADAWSDVVKSFCAERDLVNVKSYLLKNVKDKLERNRWWAQIKDDYIKKNNAEVLRLKDLNDEELGKFLGGSGKPKKTELEKVFGKKSAKALLFAYDALSYIDIALTVEDAVEIGDKLDELKREFGKRLDLYRKLFDDQQLERQAPLREAIITLEKHRSATVMAAQNLKGAQLNAFLSSMDAALGTLCLIPVTREIASVVLVLKTTLVFLKDALTTLGGYLDELLVNNYFADLKDRQELKEEIFEASVDNRKMISLSSKENGGADDLEVQLRLRAEVLYGLMQLLVRASISQDCIGETEEETRKKYLEKIERYRIQEYVQRFLLQDQWAMAAFGSCPVSMHVNWLYEVEDRQYAYKLEKEDWVVDKLLENGAGKPLMVRFGKHKIKSQFVLANFQKYFPVHEVPSSLEHFTWMFKPSFSELEKDWIRYTCIYKRPYQSHQDTDWTPINPEGNSDADELEPLTPFDQIRVLVVLDKDKAKQGLYPARLRLVRTDGSNIDGPLYKETVKPLGAELIPGEENWRGHLGCVFYPFYRFYDLTCMGIKPMASKTGIGLGEHLYYRLGFLSDMRYAFWLEVGGAKSGQWIKTGSGRDAETLLDEFPVCFNIKKEPELKHMLNRAFLTSWSKHVEYPELFLDREHDRGVGPCYIRLGGKGAYRLPSQDDFGNTKIEEFDWKTKVEFILIIWTRHLSADYYKGTNLDWKSLPLSMQLVNYEGGDVHGPGYDSKMIYLGDFRLHDQVFFKKNDSGEKLKPVVDMLEQDPKHRKAFDDNLAQLAWSDLNERRGIKGLFHIFGAYFCPDYYTFNDTQIHSVRPFASKLISYPDYYRYALVDIRAPEKIGLNVDKILTGPSTTLRPEYEFHFQAPKSYRSDVPWAEPRISEKQIMDWITIDHKIKKPKIDFP